MVCQETVLHMQMYTTTLADTAGSLPTQFAGATGRRLHWAMDLLRWDIHGGITECMNPSWKSHKDVFSGIK